MRRLRFVLALLFAPSVALAGSGPSEACFAPDATTAAIAGLALTSDRAFTFTQPNTTSVSGYFRTMEVYVTLVDSNSSITSLTMTCTGSVDNNTTDFTPKQCTAAGGVITCSSTGVFPFATPGSASWHFPVDIHAVQDVECNFTVAGGSAGAGDLITVRRVLCAN